MCSLSRTYFLFINVFQHCLKNLHSKKQLVSGRNAQNHINTRSVSYLTEVREPAFLSTNFISNENNPAHILMSASTENVICILSVKGTNIYCIYIYHHVELKISYLFRKHSRLSMLWVFFTLIMLVPTMRSILQVPWALIRRSRNWKLCLYWTTSVFVVQRYI